jgi:hypothetical protein
MNAALTAREAAALRAAICACGLSETVARFGLNAATLLRAAVGLPVHQGTATHVRSLLSQESNDAATQK